MFQSHLRDDRTIRDPAWTFNDESGLNFTIARCLKYSLKVIDASHVDVMQT